MPDEVYPIIVNPNPTTPKQKFKTPVIKLFLALILVLIASTGSWYLIQNKPWGRLKNQSTKETVTPGHPQVWIAFFEFDSSTNAARIKGAAQILNTDILAPPIIEKPEPEENKWVFQVVVNNKKGETLYSSYRKMSIFVSETNPNAREFGVAVPYFKNGILRIFDLEGNQIFVGNI